MIFLVFAMLAVQICNNSSDCCIRKYNTSAICKTVNGTILTVDDLSFTYQNTGCGFSSVTYLLSDTTIQERVR